MNPTTWSRVDAYFSERLLAPDPLLDDIQAANRNAALPAHDLAPPQAKFLHLIARAQKAASILEIGSLGGYSAVWLARALPENGRLVTIESNPKHAAVARANIQRAGLSAKIELQEGPALERLPLIAQAKRGPFDMIFIDADKENNARYFEWALRLSRAGTVIVVDNVARRGLVADRDTDDPSARGVQELCDLIKGDNRVDAVAMQTVGEKGHDGFILAIVNTPAEAALL